MTAVFSRILLRVLAGVFIGWGLQDVTDIITADPSVEQYITAGLDAVLGATVWAATEIWYWAAKKFGWRT